MKTRYVVVALQPEDNYPRVFGAFHTSEAAEEFAAKVNDRVRKHETTEQSTSNHDVMFGTAVVRQLREPRVLNATLFCEGVPT